MKGLISLYITSVLSKENNLYKVKKHQIMYWKDRAQKKN